jgi:hypothetical protein
MQGVSKRALQRYSKSECYCKALFKTPYITGYPLKARKKLALKIVESDVKTAYLWGTISDVDF